MSESPLPQRMSCRVYRCSRQSEMYLFLREDHAPDALPEPLRARTGRLTEVMQLELHAERRLARADVQQVMNALASGGFYLQMPPEGAIRAQLNDAD